MHMSASCVTDLINRARLNPDSANRLLDNVIADVHKTLGQMAFIASKCLNQMIFGACRRLDQIGQGHRADDMK